MKIRLKKGKQKELILLSKGEKSWKELSQLMDIPENYLCRDLKNENILLSEVSYLRLCNLIDNNFDKYILERLDDNWGRAKGGNKSTGSTIKIKIPEFNEDLAEFVGAVLGDGHVFYKKSDKIGVYGIRIAGDIVLDKDYHENYLTMLSWKLFSLKSKIILRNTEHNKERFVNLYSKELVLFIHSMGIKPGNKLINQSTIPIWIKNDKRTLQSCLRGLIDTDGSIFRMSNKDPHLLRISFTNYNFTLLNDTREAFINLGFHPSKVISGKQIFLSRKEDIRKYLKEIGFSNKKHLDRVKLFSPVR